MRGEAASADMTGVSWIVVTAAVLCLLVLVLAARWAEKRQADDLFPGALPPLPTNPEAGVVTSTPGTGLGSTKDAA